MTQRTELKLKRNPEPISRSKARILMLGSCFTTEVGSRLVADGFNAVINPTGNVYNPLSAARTVRLLEERRLCSEADLIENQGLWRSLDHHTRLAAPTPEEALLKINNSITVGADALNSASDVIITFGTAYVFLRGNRVVCNCHKLPAREFTRRRLSVEEITDAWQPIIDRHPDKRFIFTVSPIRHVADGLHGNQLSKATLLLAVDALNRAEYFPAYETLIDELRDYAFYASDLVHPAPEAVNRIYTLFSHSWLTD